MLPRILDARYTSDFKVWLRFSDGVQGEVDLASELYGPLFEPLRQPAMFRGFVFHPELHTLVWPNGADLAPEFLRSKLEAIRAAS